jgi:hypothetical protein
MPFYILSSFDLISMVKVIHYLFRFWGLKGNFATIVVGVLRYDRELGMKWNVSKQVHSSRKKCASCDAS